MARRMKNRFTSAIPLALALALAGCGLSSEQRLDRAEEAFAANRFNDARLDLANLLKEQPGNVPATVLMARAQLRLGDGEGALASLQRLERTGQTPDDFALLKAEAQLLRGRHDEVLELTRDMGSAEGARLAALALIGKGEIEAAGSLFARGVQGSGPKGRFFAEYALYEMRSGRLDSARSLAGRALEASPDELDPLLASARVATAFGDSDGALAAYDRALQNWPESRAALLGKVGVLGDLGRVDEIRPMIERLAKESPDDPQVLYLQGRLAAEKGDWRAVRRLLDPLSDSANADYVALHASALLELGLTEQARSNLVPIVRNVPAHLPARRLLGRAYLAAGEPGEALAVLEPVARGPQASPLDIAAYASAAKAAGRPELAAAAIGDIPPPERIARELASGDQAIKQGKWRAAIDAYERIRAWTGDENALVMNNLAFAHGKAGRTKEALGFAEKALTLAPDNPSVMETTAWLLLETKGDRARAVALLEKAARLAPGNGTIRDRLAKARRG